MARPIPGLRSRGIQKPGWAGRRRGLALWETAMYLGWAASVARTRFHLNPGVAKPQLRGPVIFGGHPAGAQGLDQNGAIRFLLAVQRDDPLVQSVDLKGHGSGQIRRVLLHLQPQLSDTLFGPRDLWVRFRQSGLDQRLPCAHHPEVFRDPGHPVGIDQFVTIGHLQEFRERTLPEFLELGSAFWSLPRWPRPTPLAAGHGPSGFSPYWDLAFSRLRATAINSGLTVSNAAEAAPMAVSREERILGRTVSATLARLVDKLPAMSSRGSPRVVDLRPSPSPQPV